MAQTITRSISIDVAQENRLQPIVAKQYDRASRFLNVQFLNMGTNMTVEQGATIVINAKRSDGQGLSFSGSVNSDGTVRVPITYWMLELDGPVVCDISIITGSSADTMLTSTSFTLEVQAAAVTNADVEENEDYPVLLELIHEVSEFEPELLDIRNGVHGQTFNSAGDAVRANANQLYNMKTGFDGVVYSSPAAMVQGEDQKLQDEIDAAVADQKDFSEKQTKIGSVYFARTLNKNGGNISVCDIGSIMPENKRYGIKIKALSELTDNAGVFISTGTHSTVYQEDVARFYHDDLVDGDIKVFDATIAFKYLRIYARSTVTIKIELFVVNESLVLLDDYINTGLSSRHEIVSNELKWSQTDKLGNDDEWKATCELIKTNKRDILFQLPESFTIGGTIYYFDKDKSVIEYVNMTSYREYYTTKEYIIKNKVEYICLSLWYSVAPSGATMFPVGVARDSGTRIIFNPECEEFGVSYNNSNFVFESGNIRGDGQDEGTTENIRSVGFTPVRGNVISIGAGLYNITVRLYSAANTSNFVGSISIQAGLVDSYDIKALGYTTAKYMRIVMWQTQGQSISPSYGTGSDWWISNGNYIVKSERYFNNPVIKSGMADATVWKGDDGWYYSWCTGKIDSTDGDAKHIMKSSNLVDWIDTGVFPFDDTTSSSILAFAHEQYSSNVIYFYAPTVIRKDGKYILYVSIQWYATIAAISDCPTGPFVWNTNSVVVDGRSGLGVTYEDSYVAKEINGGYYFFFGSHGHIYRANMKDNAMELADNPNFVRVAGDASGDESIVGNTGEGALLYHNNGYWYLFFSKGNHNSFQTPPPYHVLVGRSKTLSGTFIDKSGNALTDSDGGTTILSTDGNTSLWGPGHNAEIIVGCNNRTFMFYPRRNSVKDIRQLWLQEIFWDSDGWPYFKNDGHPIIQNNIKPFSDVIPFTE